MNKLIKTLPLLAIAALFAAPSLSFAADQSSGCGAGWYIFKKNSLVSSYLRSSTNSLLSNNTFGMTSGTSNCAKHDIVQKEKESLYFAEANQENLMVEMAQGQGENLQAFALTLGCSPDVMSDFGQMTQKQYNVIYPSATVAPAQVLERVKAQIYTHPVLAQGCVI